LVEYLQSDRGRTYIRAQLRRSQTVEALIDAWIAKHPEFSHVQHIEDQPGGEASAEEANAIQAAQIAESLEQAAAEAASADPAGEPESTEPSFVPEGVSS
jgi:hypothetical protein